MGNSTSTTRSNLDALCSQLESFDVRLGELNDARHWRKAAVPQVSATTGVLAACGAELVCNPCVSVVTGPVVGRVTDCMASVLLEVSHCARVTCIASVVTATCPQGRPVAQVTLELPAGRPRCFLLRGLVPGKRHVVVFSGVRFVDARERVASFRTLRGSEDALRVAAVCGNRPDAVTRGEVDPWERIAQHVQQGKVDVLLHLGGQVLSPVSIVASRPVPFLCCMTSCRVLPSCAVTGPRHGSLPRLLDHRPAAGRSKHAARAQLAHRCCRGGRRGAVSSAVPHRVEHATHAEGTNVVPPPSSLWATATLLSTVVCVCGWLGCRSSAAAPT
jgi:hypothetical protein